MLYRKKFVTNSSSTCFIAFGVLAAITDKDKFPDDYRADFGDIGINTTYDCYDDEVVIYLADSRIRRNEYDMWQSIEHTRIDEDKGRQILKEAAEMFGCKIIGTPQWGFFNSGH